MIAIVVTKHNVWSYLYGNKLAVEKRKIMEIISGNTITLPEPEKKRVEANDPQFGKGGNRNRIRDKYK